MEREEVRSMVAVQSGSRRPLEHGAQGRYRTGFRLTSKVTDARGRNHPHTVGPASAGITAAADCEPPEGGPALVSAA